MIQGIRVDECIWEQLYTEAEQLAQKFEILVQLSKPRTTARQTQPANIPAETRSEHWKRATFFPSTDHVCTELEDRLLTGQNRFVAQYLSASRLQELTPNLKSAVFLPFNMDISEDNRLFQKAELKRWKTKWQDLDGDLPEHLCETLELADPDMYPSVHTA